MLWKISTVQENLEALQVSAQNCRESLDYNKEIRKALTESIQRGNKWKMEKRQLQEQLEVERKKTRQVETENEEFQKLILEQRNEKVEMIEKQLTFEETKIPDFKTDRKGMARLLKMVKGVCMEKDRISSDLSIVKINMRKELRKSVTEMNQRMGKLHEKCRGYLDRCDELRKQNTELDLQVSKLTESNKRETEKNKEAEKTKEDLMQIIESANQGTARKVVSIFLYYLISSYYKKEIN